jgi:glycine/D-amino acid oxidase-like deaminating enzyme
MPIRAAAAGSRLRIGAERRRGQRGAARKTRVRLRLQPHARPLARCPRPALAHGIFGHGFKPSPAIGQVLARAALDLPADFSLRP